MPSLTIHRAANEIGGNCLEISDDKTRILFDFGLPLISMKEKKSNKAYRLKIKGIYKNQKPQAAAVFLTHAHPDHYGLLTELNPKIPVYASQITINLLKNVAPLFGNNFADINFVALKPNETIKIGGITVKSLPVDHSAPQALAYLITVAKKRILYTGDLRAHGKCGYLTEKMCKITSPDYLILEGTSLNRPAKKAETETALQKRLLKSLSGKRLPIIYFSAQNLDRFVSVYKAALTLRKMLVVDPYTCFVLEQFSSLSPNIPQWDWRNINVYFASNSLTRKLGKNIYKYKSKKISVKEILAAPEKFIIKDNLIIRQKILKETKNLNFIHSAWEGYLDEENTFYEDAKKYNLPLAILHTSGHSDLLTLKKIVKGISPKFLVPIHTTCAKEYQNIFKTAVCLLSDGEKLNLQ